MAVRGTLLLPQFLLPVRPAGTVLERHALRMVGERIDALLPAEDALVRFPEDLQVALPRHVLMPGMINLHTHSPMTLLRGVADDLPLEQWLRDHIWPAEQRLVTAQFVADGTRLAMLEMLLSGTTCFNEQYFFPEVIAREARAFGMRASVGVPIINVATPWADGLRACLARAEALMETVADDPLVEACLSPHAPYTVDDHALQEVAALAAAGQVQISMHVLETAAERAQHEQTYGMGPLARLQRFGLLGPDFLAVHMVHPDAEDMQRLADTGTQLAHCPKSNLKLASGICPLPQLLAAGLNVGVGTDGAASNNRLDLLEEVRTAALLAKGRSGDATAVDAWQALDLGTINGARALGKEAQLGSLEVGKIADMAALELQAAATQPLHQLHSQLIYSASSSQFSDVWVAGERLLSDRQPTRFHADQLLAEAALWPARFRGDASVGPSL